MSINSIGSNIPIEVSKGGIGVGTLTQYGVLYGNVTGPVQATAVGTAGQVLTSNGAGLAPTFQPISTVPGSGAWVFIQTLTGAASAQLLFNTGLSSSYPNLCFVVNNILSSSLNDRMQFQMSTDSGSTFLITNGFANYTNVSTGTWTTASSQWLFTPPLIQTTGPGLSGVFYFTGANISTNAFNINGRFVLPVGSATPYMGITTSQFPTGSAQTINAFRFSMLNGNIASGSITLYGLRNS